jgi:hypothetical protein
VSARGPRARTSPGWRSSRCVRRAVRRSWMPSVKPPVTAVRRVVRRPAYRLRRAPLMPTAMMGTHVRWIIARSTGALTSAYACNGSVIRSTKSRTVSRPAPRPSPPTRTTGAAWLLLVDLIQSSSGRVSEMDTRGWALAKRDGNSSGPRYRVQPWAA